MHCSLPPDVLVTIPTDLPCTMLSDSVLPTIAWSKMNTWAAVVMVGMPHNHHV